MSREIFLCSSTTQQSQSADTGLWWRESTAFIAGHQARRMDSLCSKDLNFQGRVLKVTLGAKGAAPAFSSNWLVVR